MKAVIFAGGTGTRLWPLSRKKSPKQFERIVGDKSTLQLAVERLYPEFKPEEVYISTNAAYKDIVIAQLPEIPYNNLIFEPAKRDVGPAVALAMAKLIRDGVSEPVVILWSDHLVQRKEKFTEIIQVGGEYIKKHPHSIIFISHKPRFASENLGWITYGSKKTTIEGVPFFSFEGFKYRPDLNMAQEFFHSGHHAWNLGYFITTPQFIHKSFKRLAPIVYKSVENIMEHYHKPSYEKTLNKLYKDIPSISFDNAVLEQLDQKDALVIVEDIGWSDVGAWEALKEALESHPKENITRGKVYLDSSSDSLVYNYDEKKLIVGVDLTETLIVDTGDVLLVAKKTSVPKIKKIVESFAGTEREELM